MWVGPKMIGRVGWVGPIGRSTHGEHGSLLHQLDTYFKSNRLTFQALNTNYSSAAKSTRYQLKGKRLETPLSQILG